MDLQLKSWPYRLGKFFYKSIYQLEGSYCLLCQKPIFDSSYKNFLCLHCHSELQNEIIDATFYHDDYKIHAFFEYKGCAKEILKEAKFRHSTVCCDLLTSVVNDYIFKNQIIALQEQVIFVPTPCSHASIKNRGWDITLNWAKSLNSKMENFSIAQAIVRNPISFYLPQQKKLNRKHREKNIHARFLLDKKFDPTHLRGNRAPSYILLDDVMTTGATLLNNFALLKGATKEAFVMLVD